MVHQPANHKKSKYIDISHNSIREQVVEFKNLIVKYVPTVDMLADPFTKNLLPGSFKDLFRKIFGLNKPLHHAPPAHPIRGAGGGMIARTKENSKSKVKLFLS